MKRSGFTLIEMLMVVVIIGVVLAFSLPKFNSLRNSGKLGSAKVHIMSSITTARAAAIQNGRRSRWTLSGNAVSVTADNGVGAFVNISPVARFDSLYNVTLSASQNVIEFDSRGLASNLGATSKIWVTGTTTDSVCVTRLGVVLRNGCL
jgi:prepilin-type N-terminal cleavage/methylation domain-containing protein